MSEYGLRLGSADVRSAGPITFGPAGILFLADNGSATVFAVDVADPGPAADPEPFDLADVDARIGSYLGCAASDERRKMLLRLARFCSTATSGAEKKIEW